MVLEPEACLAGNFLLGLVDISADRFCFSLQSLASQQQFHVSLEKGKIRKSWERYERGETKEGDGHKSHIHRGGSLNL